MLHPNTHDKLIATKAKHAVQSIAVSINKDTLVAEPVFDVTRFVDVIIALIFLVVLAPVFLLLALLIKISSRGPVIFVQPRVGKNDIEFFL